MQITKVTLYLGNLQFGCTNNNVNNAVFIFYRTHVVDTGDFVEEVLPLTMKISSVEKELSSCFRTISTATYEI